MEEETGPSSTDWSQSYRPGFTEAPDGREIHADLQQLIRERERILDAITAKDLSSGQLFKLLQENRACIDLLRGGSPSKFATGTVIYAMLAFSATVILVLAWLTAKHQLEVEVTTTFVGTVVGGMIATIAQKLGKVGR